MATWPSSLPDYPEIDGYQESKQDGAVRTQMDAGPPKQRRRFSATITEFDAVFLLDDSEIDTLETFYETTLEEGTLSFDWTHPRKGTTQLFEFRGPYQVSAIGADLFRVTCPLRVLP